MRHVIPVDGGARAGEMARDREAHAVAGLAFAVLKTRILHDEISALFEATRRDPQPVHGACHGLDEVALLHFHRVDAEVVRDLFEMELDGESRLRCAVTALRSAWRLIREDAAALEAIRG